MLVGQQGLWQILRSSRLEQQKIKQRLNKPTSKSVLDTKFACEPTHIFHKFKHEPGKVSPHSVLYAVYEAPCNTWQASGPLINVKTIQTYPWIS